MDFKDNIRVQTMLVTFPKFFLNYFKLFDPFN